MNRLGLGDLRSSLSTSKASRGASDLFPDEKPSAGPNPLPKFTPPAPPPAAATSWQQSAPFEARPPVPETVRWSGGEVVQQERSTQAAPTLPPPPPPLPPLLWEPPVSVTLLPGETMHVRGERCAYAAKRAALAVVGADRRMQPLRGAL